jgi:hypothetical protein
MLARSSGVMILVLSIWLLWSAGLTPQLDNLALYPDDLVDRLKDGGGPMFAAAMLGVIGALMVLSGASGGTLVAFLGGLGAAIFSVLSAPHGAQAFSLSISDQLALGVAIIVFAAFSSVRRT